MAGNRILIIDAGTSRTRCTVFDRDLRALGSSSREWRYLNEDGAPRLARAFDPIELRQDVYELIRETLRSARTPPGDVAAVSVTSQRQGVAFLGEDGETIYVGPNLDLRAVFEGAAIDQSMRDRVYRTTGHLPSFLFTPAKLRWFQNHLPGAYARIVGVLTLGDWLAWLLTGVQASEATLASEAGLLDVERRRWCTELLGSLDVFSDATHVVGTGTVTGTIHRDAASSTGLSTDTPVVAAGADTQCGLLGMGLSEEHEVGIVAGWSAPIQMITSRPVHAPDGRTWTGCFLAEDKWVAESTAGDVGSSYDWLANTMSGDQRNEFDRMDALASTVPAGSEGTVALLGQPRMDMSSVGMRRGGLLFPVPPTHSGTGRGHVIRASLESFAYSIRANVEQLEELTGRRAKRIALGGGMTRTPTFVQLVADVLGRGVGVAQAPNASAAGAGLCALVGVGSLSFGEAARLAESRMRPIEPDPTASSEYDDLYEEWTSVSANLQKVGPS